MNSSLPDHIIRTKETWEVVCTYRIRASSPEEALAALKHCRRDEVEVLDVKTKGQTIYDAELLRVKKVNHA